MRYKITPVYENITENKTVMPEEKYGGWMAKNIGTANTTVEGYTLAPGEVLDYRKEVPPGCVWDAPIRITVESGGVVRMVRLQCKLIKEE